MLANVHPFVRYVAKSTYFIDAKVVAPDCRIIYTISGEGIFETRGTEYAIFPGVLMYYPSGTPYRIRSQSNLLFYTLNFDLTHAYAKQHPVPFAPRLVELDDGLMLKEEGFEELSSVIYLRHAQFAETGIKRIYEESMHPTECSDAVMSTGMKLLLIDIARERSKANENPLVAKIKQTVSDDPSRNNLEIAKALGYHPYYLNEIFSRDEGISLHQYIIKMRIAKAKGLITSSEESLSEIAEECGFSSLSHLSRTLRRESGITPSKMRKIQ